MFPERFVFEKSELRNNIEDGVMPMLAVTCNCLNEEKKGAIEIIDVSTCGVHPQVNRTCPTSR
ncbi:MAG: hypothetical protein H7257_08025 [Taibaiella sp.]|nr:hypothetical protein [Taibaiella sp.]